ncbi:MAG: hypothetical protein AAF223_10440, partial [Bacteroidota bacterium]
KTSANEVAPSLPNQSGVPDDEPPNQLSPVITGESKFGLVYRLEIHLPDTQNIETYRSIFRALREELM